MSEEQSTEKKDVVENVETTETTVQAPDEKKVREALSSGGVEADMSEYDLSDNSDETATETVEKEVIEQKDESQEEIQESHSGEQQQTVLSTQPLWDEIKKEYEEQLGEGTFVMPEGLTPENEKVVLLDFLQKNLEPSYDDLPEEAKEIAMLYKEGKYDPEKYFKERSKQGDLTNLSDEEFLFQVYKTKNGKSDKNPTGWDDSEIRSFLSKKEKIELHEMAEAGRRQYEQQKEERMAEAQRIQAEARRQEFEKFESQRIQRANEVVNQHKNTREFFGLELSEPEVKQFNKDFLEMVKINKETGMHKISEMLNDDNTLYKVAALLWKGEEGLKGYISDIKEGVKKNLEQKLDPTLEKEKGTTKMAKPVDREKLV